MWQYQFDVFRQYGGLVLKPGGLPPEYPFIHSLRWTDEEDILEELKWLLWCMLNLYMVGIEFSNVKFFNCVSRSIVGRTSTSNQKHFMYVLSWFQQLQTWKVNFRDEMRKDRREPERQIVVFFHRPWTFIHSSGEISNKPTRVGQQPTNHNMVCSMHAIIRLFPTVLHYFLKNTGKLRDYCARKITSFPMKPDPLM